ncbi:MAG: heme lyase CcmF/NrfE family subunit [Dehalococcoidia bacterium]|nr:heme lyase CcmF/NrfE family subunit [Dehalococcoidia bacterium]
MSVLAALGAAALLVALGAAVAAVAGALLGARARPGALAAARRALLVAAAAITVAVGALAVALLRDDFSLAYVAAVSSRELDPPLKWAALYSAQAGSLLLWTWLLSLFVAVFAWRTLPAIPWGAAPATAIAGALLVAFLVPAVAFESAFAASPVTPLDGRGLNPLLVDRGMLVHPPFLLAGLVSTAIPFTLGMSALAAGRVDGAWLRAVRGWALCAWLVLSIGNFLGGWWAYTVLGWGGYWGWDPVENSALLPLLPLTAFLHSLLVQERRGMLKLWNVGLVVAAFALAVFGTFNVRSGLVESVHSFARSDIGGYFLALLAVLIAGAGGLMAWRARMLRPGHDFESLLSRESALIVNNYLFLAITLVVLGGTLFPVFSELFDGTRITVGPPFFNRVVGPLLVALVVLMVIGTVLPWRRAAGATLARRFRGPLVVAVAAGLALGAGGMRDPFALTATCAATVLLFVTLREFAIGARGVRRASGVAWPAALAALFERDQQRYGGYLVHLGVGVLAIAIVGSNIYQQQIRATVAPGGSFEAGGRTLTFDGLQERAPARNGIDTEVVAALRVTRGGEERAPLAPGRRLFTNFPQQPTSIIAIEHTWRDDLYVFVQGWDADGVTEFQVFVNPLMPWLWAGAGVYIVGGLLAFVPLRARPALVTAPAREPAAARS